MNRQSAASRMQDPAGGVPQQLLPHMHLVSSYRYPLMANLSMETAVDYLLSAPKIVRELQPVHWMFLDAPSDGTVMLTWQPLSHLGTNFASDGYVWGDAEQVYTTEAKGYTVEMWLHRCGYHAPHETIATHARRRFRLTPSKTPNPNIPPPDPSLWIVHYSKAPSIDQIPATHISVSPPINAIIHQRRFLQSQGQLARKEFMLHDRNSWPTINYPPQVGQQPYAQHNPYAQPYLARQAQPPFLAHSAASAQAAQAKSARGSRAAGAAAMAGAAHPDFSLEDEEVSTGDFLDNITPREISRLRYRNNHEWMEEIFDSPYRINQILPVDLGMGRKGELEPLTKDYLEAPTTASSAAANAAKKMDSEKFEEFNNAVTKKVADVTAEIEALKKKHAKRLEKIGRLSMLKDGEKELRDAYVDPANVGREFWRIEDRLKPIVFKEDSLQQVELGSPKPKTKVADISTKIEQAWGAQIVSLRETHCVDKGGFQEPVPESPEPTESIPPIPEIGMAGDEASKPPMPPPEFGGAAAQFPPRPGMLAPGSQGNANGGGQIASQGTSQPLSERPSADVEMGGVNEAQVPQPTDQLGEDWVIVDKNNKNSKNASPTENQGPVGGEQLANVPTGKGLEAAMPVSNTSPDAPDMLETSNFEDAASFSHIDSAGDALAVYEDNHGLDLEGLDHSAFGDAFHASEGEHQHHDTDDIA